MLRNMHIEQNASYSTLAHRNRSELAFSSQAFGLRWRSDHSLHQFGPDVAGLSEVTVARVDRLLDRSGGAKINNGEILADGARFRFGDAVFDTYGDDSVTWWSPSAEEIPAAFYGTVVAIVLAWRGLVPLHGSAVELDGKALLIAGPAGAGKSTLCEALTRKGGRLISDDLSVLALGADGRPTLIPGRPAIRLAIPGEETTEKKLHAPAAVDPATPVELRTLVVLGVDQIGIGPVAAAEMLHLQLFRPRWMKMLPRSRDRTATLFHAAQKVQMFSLPHANDRPDLGADDKADAILTRLSGGRIDFADA